MIIYRQYATMRYRISSCLLLLLLHINSTFIKSHRILAGHKLGNPVNTMAYIAVYKSPLNISSSTSNRHIPSYNNANKNIGNKPTRLCYTVTLLTPEGEKTIESGPEDYILESAEEQGIELPFSCRGGSCSTCAATLVKGDIDNSEQSYLSQKQVDQGYCLLCTSYAKSDCTIATHKEQQLHAEEELQHL